MCLIERLNLGKEPKSTVSGNPFHMFTIRSQKKLDRTHAVVWRLYNLYL